MRYLFVIITIILLNPDMNSQTDGRFMIGVNAGLTYSNIVVDKNKNLTEGQFPGSFNIGTLDYYTGFAIGLNSSYSLSKKFIIETCLDFYRNGYNWYFLSSATTTDTVIYDDNNGTETKFSHNYINNAWLAGYKFGNRFQFIIQAGGYWAICIRTKIKVKHFFYVDSAFYYGELHADPDPWIHAGYNEFYTVQTSTNANNPIDYGIVVGYEFLFNISERLFLFHNFRYYRGLSNVSNSGYDKIYNKSYFFGTGIKMKF